jgi:hypothetical protein
MASCSLIAVPTLTQLNISFDESTTKVVKLTASEGLPSGKFTAQNTAE